MFEKILKHEYFNIVAASVCVTLIITLTGVGYHYYYYGENDSKPIVPPERPTTSEIPEGTTSFSRSTTEETSTETISTTTIEEISKLAREEILNSTTSTISKPELKSDISEYIEKNNSEPIVPPERPTTSEIPEGTTSSSRPTTEETSTETISTTTIEELSKSTREEILNSTISKPELKPDIRKYIQKNYSAPVALKTCKESTNCNQNEVCNDEQQCVCGYGYKWDSKGHCLENNECDCLEGAYSDNATCAAKKTVNFLLVVKDVSAEREETSSDIDWLNYPRTYISADNDCNNGEVYLIKRNDAPEITKMSYNGGNARRFLSLRGRPEGLSINWVLNKIFWIDSEKERISVVDLNDAGNIETLIDEEINNPRDIVVHPGKKKIFWTDWTEEEGGKLMWANENGSDVGIFYQGDHVQYPNALAINWEKNHLCWSDVKTLNISCVDIFNTTNVQTLVTNISDPFDLGVLSNRFYFTSRLEKEIRQFDGEEFRVLMPTPEDADEYLYGFVPVPPKCPELKT